MEVQKRFRTSAGNFSDKLVNIIIWQVDLIILQVDLIIWQVDILY